jgi:MYXO-CTERM domain-containing protein
VKHPYASAAVLGLAALLVTGTASAHIKLRSPTPRDPNNPLKSAPCGPATTTRGSTVTMLTSGQKITLSWDETIQHPGHYRIAFDDDGNDFTDPTSFTDIAAANKDLGNGVIVLLDGIMDKTSKAYTAEVTLPDIECNNCTLQLIQVMTDKAPYGNGDDIYHECANLVLKKAGGAAAGSGAAGAAAGAGGAAAGAGGVTAGAGAGGSGGAAAAGTGAAGSGVAGAGVAGAPPSSGAGSTGSAAGSGVAGSVGGAGSLGTAAGSVAPAPVASPEDSGCAVASAGSKHDFGWGSVALAAAALAVLKRRRRRR